MVGSHKGQAQHIRRGSQETVGWVLVRERQFLRRHDYFVRQRSFLHVQSYPKK